MDKGVGIVELKKLKLELPVGGLKLSYGGALKEIEVAYEECGAPIGECNVIYICHALTGDSHVAGIRPGETEPSGWWEGMVGPGRAIDTNRYHVICANVIGGCSGTTGPMSINPDTGKPYGSSFPQYTFDDAVDVFRMLLKQLGVKRLAAVIGGSFGGMQVVNWMTRWPDDMDKAILVATSANLNTQAIAFSVMSRNSITDDPKWQGGDYYQVGDGKGPRAGLASARQLAHITYLSRELLQQKFHRCLQRNFVEAPEAERKERDRLFKTYFQIESYLDYQAMKFVKRFDANSYLHITRSMDLVDPCDMFGSLDEAFARVKAKTLVVSYAGDILFPVWQSKEIVASLMRAGKSVSYCHLESGTGHDSFLTDIEDLSKLVGGFLGNRQVKVMRWQERAYSKIVRMVHQGAHIVDIGCGDGTLLNVLRKQRGVRGDGVEIDVERFEEALADGHDMFWEDADEGLEVVPDQHYDTAIVSDTLQEVKNPRGLLHEALRIAKEAIVTFPNFAAYRIRFTLGLMGRLPVSKQLPFEWYDTPNIHCVTLKDFANLCEKEGIVIKEVQAESRHPFGKLLLLLGLKNLGASRIVARIARKSVALLALLLSVATSSTMASERQHGLWYSEPAEDSEKGWEHQSLPIGCGWFGANVFGGVTNDRVQITHNALLTSRPHFNGETGNLTDALEIRLKTAHNQVSEYRRGLDLATATAWTEYSYEGVRYRREYIASYPAKVLAMRLTASRKGALSFRVSAEAPFLCSPAAAIGEKSGMGRTAKTDFSERGISVYQEFEYFAIRFASELRVATDGNVRADGNALAIADATEAVVFASFETNYRLRPEIFFESNPRRKLEPTDPRPAAKSLVDNAIARGWQSIRDEHLRDVAGLFGRVYVDLGGDDSDAKLPTDELLSKYRQGRASAYLEETYFQYGRYLLMSSSRPGTLPANLQGVWNCHRVSPWGAGYWHNINVQMNYWPAFSGNLAECFQAYADFNAAFRPASAALARDFVIQYAPENLNARGESSPDWWSIGTASYPYMICGGPGGHSGPGTGGLTTKLFMDWWEFTHDEQALRQYIWPTIHGMANFLTRCVRNYGGKWLSVFSASPEQIVPNRDWTWGEGRTPYYSTIGCAFDQQLIWENSHDLVKLAAYLGTNDEVVAKARFQLPNYDPVQIGESGQIKEYREERKYGEIGEAQHRHISQLVGLMPGTLITADRPEWMEAAKITLNYRGDKSTGWALAHRLCAWARIGDGDRAHLLLGNLLRERTNDNLWDMHPPFQIDGNFGATAGIIEMLIQSHAGRIDLLPALPKDWAKRGAFRGLCARGAFVVDCEWENGRPTRARVKSLRGQKPDVRFAGKPFKAEEL